MDNDTINIEREKLGMIYQLLHSIEIKGDAVDKVAYVKQIIVDELNKDLINKDVNEVK